MITLAYLLVCVLFTTFAVLAVASSWFVYGWFALFALIHMWAAWFFRKEA